MGHENLLTLVDSEAGENEPVRYQAYLCDTCPSLMMLAQFQELARRAGRDG